MLQLAVESIPTVRKPLKFVMQNNELMKAGLNDINILAAEGMEHGNQLGQV